MSEDTKSKLLNIGTELIKTVGFPIVVAAALLWMGYLQMQEASAAREKDAEFIRSTLVELVRETNKTTAECTEAMRALAKEVSQQR